MADGSKSGRRLSRADLDRLIRGLGKKPKGPQGIPRQPRERSAAGEVRFPASFAQRRLWLVDRLTPGRATYNLAGAIELRPVPDRATPGDVVTAGPTTQAIRSTLGRLLGRHEVLRTHFVAVDGEPWQVITDPDRVSIELPVVDLQAAGTVSDPLDRALSSEARRPFDLSRGPLLRAILWRIADHRQILQLTLHHTIADGWSLGLLLRELGSLLEGKTLDPLPVQVADHGVWQRRRLEDGKHEASLETLRQQLAGVEPLELPSDRRRPSEPSGRGRQVPFTLAGPVAESLRGLAREHGTTLFAVLAAALGAFLARHTPSTDLTIGFPVAGRRRRELEALVGFFVNTLVLRLDLAGDPTVVELIADSDAAVRRAEEHQEIPFEQVVEALAPERSAGRAPLFQVILAYEAAGLEPIRAGDVELRPRELWTGTAKFDLGLTLREVADSDGPRRLAGWWEADADLFDLATVETLAERFTRLVEGLAQGSQSLQSGIRLSTLPVLDDREIHQLTREWNGSPRPFPSEATIPARIAEVAAAAPDAVAVVFQETAAAGDGARVELSYGELVTRSRRLATVLRSRGAGRGSLVGVCLERSPELVVALLAVLEAGAAYLPLDLAYPDERLAFMLEDGGVSVLVAESSLADRLPTVPGVDTVSVDTVSVDTEDGARGPRFDPLGCDPLGSDPLGSDSPGPDDLAYVIYTSGSTGQPKGVPMPHRSVARLLSATEPWFGFGRDDVWTFFHSHAFDFSVWELWGCLMTGGRLVVVPYLTSRSPEAMAELLRDEKVTVLNQTPSAFRQLTTVVAAAPEGAEPRHLRTVIFGGEALEPATLGPWFERFGDQRPRLVNMYGITETTVHVTYRPLAASDEGIGADGPSSPLGEVIPDQTLRLLDRHGGVSPRGSVGEIHVGGAGLAWGYLGRPGLTAQRFVPDPWGAPGSRQYRSGDLARYVSSGDLDFLGRIDHQVKVRGFRIELGEIETALLSEASLSEVVVLAQGQGAETRLVAYVVAAPGSEAPEPQALREALGHRLPDYMVPSAFAILDALPLTANGKLDRAALGRLDLAGLDTGTTGGPPRNPIEVTLVRIFESLLGVEGLGIDADFFQLGGHSLLATRFLARVREELGVDLPLRVVFDTPTVAELALQLEPGTEVPVMPILEPLEPRSEDEPGPLTFAQERLWFLHQLAPDDPTYHVGLGLDFLGQLDRWALATALATLRSRHEVLRSRFPEVDGQPTRVVDDASELALPRVDLATIPAGQRDTVADRLAEREVRRPFDLGTGPLIRGLLLDLGSGPDGPVHRLVLTLHHIVSDGWSLGLLLGEVAVIYEASRAGLRVELPKLQLQVADFAAWQRRLLADEALREPSLAYWRETLAEVPVLALPTDRPRRARVPRRGAWHSVRLAPKLAEGLRRASSEQGGTVFTGLLAGFRGLLSRLSGQADFALGTTLASRRDVDLEALIGDFVDTVALRFDGMADLGGTSFGSLLVAARDRMLEADAHRLVPFERVIEALDLDRDLSVSPVFQAMLVLLNTPTGSRPLQGVELSVRPLSTGTAKFDLTLSLAEGGGDYDASELGSGGLPGVLEYDRDLFDATTVERWWRSFETLLEAALTDPARPLDTLPMLAAGERHQLVWEWNGSPEAFPSEVSIPAQVAAVTQARPSAVAVVGEGLDGERIELSYGELVEHGRRVAAALRRRGVGRGSLVGVCLERSVDLVVALLGVLESGAAYLPIDLAYPAERLAFLLEDGGAPVLLSQRSLADRLPEVAGVETVWVESLWTEGSAEADGNEPAPSDPPNGALPDPDDLAYVIYTSGSTGRPKGVPMPHRSVARLMSATEPWFGFGPKDVWTFFHSHAFDFSVWELWGCLMTGGRLVVVPYLTSRSPEALATLVRSEGVTILNQTPSAFRQLMAVMVGEGSDDAAPLTLRRVIFGGEALEPATLAPWFERFGDTHPLLVNMYGITETTVHVTYCPLSLESTSTVASSAAKPPASPVGVVIPDQTVRLLDPCGRPSPMGVAGEIHVGGAGLAWGYLGRPGLTAERFVPDPWGEPGARQYRSGDLARYLGSGELDFLGRIDHQVKIRGFRIELGEIESALSAHPAVSEAAVLAEGSGDTTRLVAYVVVGEKAPSVAVLREMLGQQLPDYMVPSAFALLDELPLTTNGKLDRRALQKLDVDSGAPVGTGGPPRTPSETLLARLFEEVLDVAGLDVAGLGVEGLGVEGLGVEGLGVEGLGVGADFFRLGGHSLLATRLVARLRDEGVEIPLRTVFEASTIEALARHVEVSGGAGDPEPWPEQGLVAAEPSLTFAQERLWFLHRLAPDDPSYNIGLRLDLEGRLDGTALRTALGRVVARHEVLRARFPESEGRPVVSLSSEVEVPLPRVSLSSTPREDAHRMVDRLSAELVRRPYDLATGPLLRAVLFELPPSPAGRSRYRMLLMLHHTVADGGSLGILLHEVATFYGARVTGTPAELAPPRLQVWDVAAWQRGLLADTTRRETALEYWRQTLEGVPVLALPTDRPRRLRTSRRGSWHRIVFPAERVGRLRSVSRAAGGTFFTGLLATLGALLARLTAQEDFAVGTAMATRRRSEFEGTIGDFVETLALRLTPAGSQSLGGLLAEARGRLLDAEAHHQVPFEQVLPALDVDRDLATTPIFQVMLVLHDTPTHEAALPGLDLSVSPLSTGTAKFDLTLSLGGQLGDRSGTEDLEGMLEFDRDLFDATTIDRWWRSFETLLEGALEEPERPLAALPLLTAGERHQLVWEWNATPEAFPAEATIPARIAAVARSRPEAVAVVGEGLDGGRVELSYGELVERSHRVARTLRRRGVGRGTRVGVCLERSVDLVVTLLGVLESGAAYLPIDLAYPAERLAFLLEDGGAPVLLSQRSLVDRLPEVAGVETVWIDGFEAVGIEDAEEGASGSETSQPGSPHPTDLAYVIYTSGSTGRPKGVLIPHQNVSRLLSATQPWFGFGPEDVWTFFHSHAFDFSVWELWACLATGGRLVVVPYWQSRSPEALATLLRTEGVTILNQTPSAFRQLMTVMVGEDSDEDERLTLRRVIFGGEALEPATLAPWFERFGDTHPLLVNMFGITETTVHVTYRPLSLESASPQASSVGSPVGVVIPDQTVRLLDPRGRPSPLGVAGEIHVGGAGLAWGYLGRPGLTAERFVPDPWGEPGARQYRSGDLGRYLASGELDFLGRIDHQVKVRGFRIELGEIEAALLAHPAISEAVVLAEGSGDTTRLVAYVVPGGETPAVSELRESLGARLPDYMVPSAFSWLDALPLTANGKLDRRALQRLEVDADAPVGTGGPPRTATETLLARLFGEVLGVEGLGGEGLGVEADFFQLGGHSLLATQLVARLVDEGIEVPLRTIFEAPTIEALAHQLEGLQGSGHSPASPTPPAELPPIPRLGATEAPLSFAQERLWFLEQLAPGSLYNLSGGLRFHGPLDPTALTTAFAGLIRRHAVLRTVFHAVEGGTEGAKPPSDSGQPVQRVRSDAAAELPMVRVDLRALPHALRAPAGRRLAQTLLSRPFDLERGPLIRGCLVESGDDEHTFFVVLHHVVTDGWSQNILLSELAELYSRALTAEGPSRVDALPVQYTDYAIWQRQWLQGEAEQEQLEWWREALAEVPRLELPTDRPRPAIRRQRGRLVEGVFDRELADGLRALAQDRGASLFMVLVAGFRTLAWRLTGQTDLPLGTPVAGRRRTELEGLVGFFVNTLVLRSEIDTGHRFSTALAAVRDLCLEAWARQDLPFERLVAELAPERELSQTPLFQVLVTLQDGVGAVPDFAGLDVEPLVVEVEEAVQTAKFDLSLVFSERVDGGLDWAVEADRDLFDATTLRRWLGSLGHLLRGAVVDPERTVESLPSVSRAAHHQLAVEWSSFGPAPWSRNDEAVIDAVWRDATVHPRALAVAMGDDRLDRRELFARAGALSETLRGIGIGPEDVVAVCIERSPDMVVAILAIQSTGAAYLPLDSHLPDDRLVFMVRDSRALALVASASQRSRFESLGATGLRILDPVASVDPGDPNDSGTSPRVHDLRQLAYIIYTSGSTGRPKGVGISHGTLRHLVAWHNRAYGLVAGSRAIQLAGPAFDASVWEIWPTLAAGASLHLPSEEVRADAVQLVDWMREERIEVAFLPTPLGEAALTSPEIEWGDALRWLLTGGDRLRHRPTTELPFGLINHYGPTENTVVATGGVVEVDGGPNPDIGRPLPAVSVQVLGPDLRPIPLGGVGELVLGADPSGVETLARGYHRRPALTAAVFVPDPTGLHPGGRVYRTGDLARWTPDGRLDFVGRRDHQVQVRGFRIELGEIEAELLAIPEVAEAVVLARGEGPSSRLVAFVVATPETELPSQQAIRRTLAGQLPDYMVPSAFVVLEALPQTANGKLDRRALGQVEVGELGIESRGGPPRNPTEAALVEIFESLLEVEGLEIGADFFELGGHSLLATRLLARVREELAVELPLKAVFETPTVAGLALRLGSEAKSTGPILEPLRPRSTDEASTLTFAQERLWFLHQLTPTDPSYHVGLVLEFVGNFDPRVMERALSTVRSRHEVLRSRFPEVDGQPTVVVEPLAGLALPRVDLSALPDATRSAVADQLASGEMRRPFDLGAGPLLRQLLLDLGSGDDGPNLRLVLVLHHIVSDGWSLGILLEELATVYSSRSGHTGALLPLGVQVADFAAWQRRLFADASLREPSLAFWRETLGGVPVLTLPTDRPRRTRTMRRGAVRAVQLSPHLVDALRQVSSQRGGTLFTGLLAGFWGLLARLSGQGDFAIGTALGSRRDVALESLIGDFVDTVALRFRGVEGFGELLESTRDRLFEAEAHRLVPFERVLGALDLDRDLAVSPLFQAMLVLLNAPSTARRLPGVELSVHPLSTGTSKFDLTLSLAESGSDYDLSELGTGGLLGMLEYDRDLFDASTLERWWRAFETMLSAATMSPERSLWELPILRPSELHELIHERAWGPSAPRPRSLPEVLAKRLVAEGDAPALVMSGDPSATLSFAELAERAAALATELRAAGVGPESVVALMLERSPALVVSALAVWWAGGAYVPLDLEHPESRQSFQLADSGAGWLIGSGERAERLAESVAGILLIDSSTPSEAGAPLTLTLSPGSGDQNGPRPKGSTHHQSPIAGVGLGGESERKRSVPRLDAPAKEESHARQESPAGPHRPEGVGERSEPRPTPATLQLPDSPDSLAYVLYTSGSTGRPKGVEVTHGGLARYVDWAMTAYRADEGTGTLVHSPLGFDLTVTGLWVPLAAGRPVTLISESEGVEGLERALRSGDDRTLVKLTPSHLEVLRHRVPAKELSGRARALVIGGEALHAETLAPWLEHAPETRLINEYGPTETVVGCCVEIVESGDTVDEAVVPIGRPIAGAGLWVVDRRLHPVPPGCVGELVIGGDGVARGYRGRPGLTAERFVPDPFGGRPGSRLYTSGDRVRSLRDGRLTYLGRTDQQVKIRGHRIEPGEIEAAALALPGVDEAVVVARSHTTGPRLVAYVTGEATPEAVDSGLRDALPAAWLPSAVRVLDALPRLPNGKFDRRHLPEPSWSGESAGRAPSTALEAELLELWVSLLELDTEVSSTVGVDSDFFRLGGHSLLATRLLARVRDRWGVEVTLRELFEGPTVARLAAVVEASLAGEPHGARRSAGAPIERLASDPKHFALSFSQERLWILDRLEPGNAAYNMPYSLRLRGALDAEVLVASLAALLARHQGLRTRFDQVDGRPIQIVERKVELPLLRIDLERLAPGHGSREIARLTRWVTLAAIDLSRGPLLRCALVRRSAEDHVLMLSVHHSVADGWSLGILTRELGAFYEAGVTHRQITEEAAGLAPIPLRYVDYAHWQRGWLVGDELERQLAYWREHLAGLPPVLDLPTDQGRPAIRDFQGGSSRLDLGLSLSRGVRALSRERGATVFMTLLAAFQVVLGRLAGQQQFAIGSPVAGRNRAETEDLVGMFLNTLVLRADLDGDPTFGELLERVRITALGAYDHQDVPFEKLLDTLALERDLSRTPLFQVFFNLLNLPLGPLHLSALEIEPLELGDLRSKFDLTVYANDPGDDAGSDPGGDAGAITFEWVYNANLFSSARIEAMSSQFHAVLEQVVADPDRRLSEIDLRTPAMTRLLPDPSETLDGTWRGAIHQWMAQRATENPEATAVESPEGRWSYGELAAASHRLAHRLVAAGLERGDAVALVAHRSASLVWSVFGSLAAGGAFVLLDPAYPAERLVRILERARPRAILRLVAAGPLGDEVDTFLEELAPVADLLIPPWSELAGFGEGWSEGPVTPPPVEVGPEDAAAIGFTSGSTGLPKGIVGRHGPLTHFLPWQCERFDLGPGDRYSLLSGLAHDPIQRDLFTSMATGATLCLPDPDELLSAGYLAGWLGEARVTVAHLTPAMAQVVSAGGEAAGLPDLRRVFLTGDVLSVRDVERLERLAPAVRCVNFYGSTETQRAVGYREADLAAEPGRKKEILALGRGMEDVQLLVAGPSGALAGIGELGEIWVRSPHLARGYLGDPAETASRFRVNPFGARSGDDRVYRTGDLGRYRPDGDVEFAGRADQQVKIRGFRIELGEIVGCLVRQPSVADAAVVLDSGAGGRQLVACVVPASGHGAEPGGVEPGGVDPDSLRAAVRAELPDYMVPSRWLNLDALPITPNGKLDRRALARAIQNAGDGPSASAATSASAAQAPRTQLERLVVSTLSELLGGVAVGLGDNFFDLGGNSLLLVELHGRLRAALDRDFPAIEIFQHPTAGTLATYLAGLEGAADATPVDDRSEQLKTGRDRLRQRRRRLTGRSGR